MGYKLDFFFKLTILELIPNNESFFTRNKDFARESFPVGAYTFCLNLGSNIECSLIDNAESFWIDCCGSAPDCGYKKILSVVWPGNIEAD